MHDRSTQNLYLQRIPIKREVCGMSNAHSPFCVHALQTMCSRLRDLVMGAGIFFKGLSNNIKKDDLNCKTSYICVAKKTSTQENKCICCLLGINSKNMIEH